MSQYIALPQASNLPVEVATGTAIKTVLQVGVPATAQIDRILGWGISFKGTSSTDAPGVVQLVDVDVAATVTALTPTAHGQVGSDEPASAMVGGAALTGYNASAEGTITSARILDAVEVHPQSGYAVWFPEEGRQRIKVSRFLRIRTTFAVSVNCLPWIVWRE